MTTRIRTRPRFPNIALRALAHAADAAAHHAAAQAYEDDIDIDRPRGGGDDKYKDAANYAVQVAHLAVERAEEAAAKALAAVSAREANLAVEAAQFAAADARSEANDARRAAVAARAEHLAQR